MLAAGKVGASLRMHPLAMPVLVAGELARALDACGRRSRSAHRCAFIAAGSGQAAIGAAIVVYAAAFVLWILRFLGYFGGPVPDLTPPDLS